MMVGIITGSGMHALPGFEPAESLSVETPYGPASLTKGTYAGADVLHISRHGAGHVRLSNQVTHRENVWALKELGATAVIACTACGAIDPTLELGSLVVFDDLHSPRIASPTVRSAPSSLNREIRGGPIGSSTAARSRERFVPRCWERPRMPVIPLATAAPTGTSTARASTLRPRSRSSRGAVSWRSA